MQATPGLINVDEAMAFSIPVIEVTGGEPLAQRQAIPLMQRLLERGATVLLITCCIWWIYFDDVASTKLRKQRGAFEVWFYGHLPLAIGITAVGVGLK